MLRPTPGQLILTADGRVWVVHKVVGDELEADNYVIQLLPEDRKDDFLAETLDVYMADWPDFCLANGVAISQFGDL